MAVVLPHFLADGSELLAAGGLLAHSGLGLV
jgi:hypothetical protein